MKIVLISGKAEAGKTTVANILRDILTKEHGKRVATIAYGDYLKFTAEKIWNWNGKKDEAGRHLLQWWGTDIVRAKEPNFWVDAVERLAELAKDELDYLIIDDCRFKNEIELWKEHNYIQNDEVENRLVMKKRWPDILTVRVERPGHENALTPEQRQHPSEMELDDYIFDVTLSATNRDELWSEIRNKLLFGLRE